MDLGKRLKKLRLEAGLNAKELSVLSGVTRSLISELESGKRQSTSIDTIAKLAQTLQVSPAYFFETEYLSPSKIAPHWPQDMLQFLQQEESKPYIRMAQKAQALGLQADLLEDILDIVDRFRTKGQESSPI